MREEKYINRARNKDGRESKEASKIRKDRMGETRKEKRNKARKQRRAQE
jgi:hypothetical protein